jgi:hypothetical protein
MYYLRFTFYVQESQISDPKCDISASFCFTHLFYRKSQMLCVTNATGRAVFGKAMTDFKILFGCEAAECKRKN